MAPGGGPPVVGGPGERFRALLAVLRRVSSGSALSRRQRIDRLPPRQARPGRPRGEIPGAARLIAFCDCMTPVAPWRGAWPTTGHPPLSKKDDADDSSDSA